MMGDFNFPNTNWDDLSCNPGAPAVERQFVDMAFERGLHQAVREHTYFGRGIRPACLDLLFVKAPSLIASISSLPPIATTDHIVLMAQVRCRRTTRLTQRLIPNPHKANFDMMRLAAQQLDWSIHPDAGPDEAWHHVKSLISLLCNSHVPLKKAGGTARAPPWVDRNLRRLMRKRRRRWHIFRENPSDETYEDYRVIRNEVTEVKRNQRRAYEEMLASSYPPAPKRIYAYVSRRSRKRDEIPSLRDPSGSLVAGDNERAELLADHFSACYSSPTAGERLDGALTSNGCLERVECSENIVRHLLSTLDTSKAPGPDGIHPVVLKQLATVIAKPITDLFNISLTAKRLPAEWKHGIVKPFPKTGDLSDADNYRPICLTSTLCKVLEKVVKRAVMDYLQSINTIPASQHGFVPGRSCLTNLLLAREAWTEARERGEQVDAVLFDFSKAFDKVSHRLLLDCLVRFQIRGDLLTWVEDFLHNRTWCVRVNGYHSSIRTAASGVPQGSVLGPMLFVLYVSEVPLSPDTKVLLYADDLKIWRTVRTPADSADFQRDIDRIASWATAMQLPINTTKNIASTYRSDEPSSRLPYRQHSHTVS